MFKAHRLLYHSTLGLRVNKVEEGYREEWRAIDEGDRGCRVVEHLLEWFELNLLVLRV